MTFEAGGHSFGNKSSAVVTAVLRVLAVVVDRGRFAPLRLVNPIRVAHRTSSQEPAHVA
ncbi:hypothetical protein [Streptomyces akebiae]|uniref:Uncharacterized protein n=1 Tax=Streptomyces akebiae TaxID=2865673 RepID=A0ABX8XTZ9_9ACTN|nr:hypothetical protein [Streptomyces akebiae]QYX79405.1 hypothetical protein K1J60_25405 [Streptomyces akebiae]